MSDKQKYSNILSLIFFILICSCSITIGEPILPVLTQHIDNLNTGINVGLKDIVSNIKEGQIAELSDVANILPTSNLNSRHGQFSRPSQQGNKINALNSKISPNLNRENPNNQWETKTRQTQNVIKASNIRYENKQRQFRPRPSLPAQSMTFSQKQAQSQYDSQAMRQQALNGRTQYQEQSVSLSLPESQSYIEKESQSEGQSNIIKSERNTKSPLYNKITKISEVYEEEEEDLTEIPRLIVDRMESNKAKEIAQNNLDKMRRTTEFVYKQEPTEWPQPIQQKEMIDTKISKTQQPEEQAQPIKEIENTESINQIKNEQATEKIELVNVGETEKSTQFAKLPLPTKATTISKIQIAKGKLYKITTAPSTTQQAFTTTMESVTETQLALTTAYQLSMPNLYEGAMSLLKNIPEYLFPERMGYRGIFIKIIEDTHAWAENHAPLVHKILSVVKQLTRDQLASIPQLQFFADILEQSVRYKVRMVVKNFLNSYSNYTIIKLVQETQKYSKWLNFGHDTNLNSTDILGIIDNLVNLPGVGVLIASALAFSAGGMPFTITLMHIMQYLGGEVTLGEYANRQTHPEIYRNVTSQLVPYVEESVNMTLSKLGDNLHEIITNLTDFETIRNIGNYALNVTMPLFDEIKNIFAQNMEKGFTMFKNSLF